MKTDFNSKKNANIFFFKARVKNTYLYTTGYFFKYNNKLYIVNRNNLKKLKNELTLPFNVETYALSRANIGSIIRILKDDDTIISYKVIRVDNDKYLRYLINFNKKEKVLVKYK